MSNNTIDMSRPIFQTVEQVATVTGLSKWSLRQGLKAGTIPHIRCGRKILINLPQLLAELENKTSHSPVNL